MSIEQALRQKYGEELNEVGDVEELILDEIAQVPTLSQADKQFLERFKTLTSLSMNNLGLVSLANFPAIPTLMLV